MSPKIKQALSLFVSTTVVLAQPSTVVYATGIEQIVEESIQLLPQEAEEEILPYAAAVNPKVVYTQATKSNSDRSGNGSKSNPYNRFEDAVANVEDGGTIIIKTGRSGFINTYDEYGKYPFVIDKNITIRSESDDVKAVLNVRTGGIILDADVTFENINFSFANKLHDSIFANGHKLTIVDCVRDSGSRQIDLFAGSLYDADTGAPVVGVKYDEDASPIEVAPTPGKHGQIMIETSKGSPVSEFGKVFAGSMNGNFEGDVDIEIINKGNLELVSIHSSGAEETSPGPMFDLTEPVPPQEKPNEYTVDGTVNLYLTNYGTDINGEGAEHVNATLSHRYTMANFAIEDINSLTIQEGTFIPDSITWKNNQPGDLTLANEKSILELSQIKTLEVDNLDSNGILTFQEDGELTIHNHISGQTLFQTVLGAVDNSSSGPVLLGHTYITSLADEGDSDSFIFKPGLPSQNHYLLEKVGSTWQITEDPNKEGTFLPDTITNFDFDVAESTLTFVQGGTTHNLAIPFTIGPNVELEYAFMDELECEIFINGKKAIKHDEYDNSWYDPDLNLYFDVFNDNLSVGPIINEGSSDPVNVAFGTYEIVVSFPTYNISSTTQLNVVPPDMANPTVGKIDFDIRKDAMSVVQEADFGEQIEIHALVTPTTTSINPLALQDQVDVMVNGQIIESHLVNNDLTNFTLAVTPENGFKAGSNKIKLIYGGSAMHLGSSLEKEFTVNKMTPNLALTSDKVVTYDGKPHSLEVIGDSNITMEPTVYYYTDEQYSQGETTVPPIHAGTYYVKAILPETDRSHYKAVTGRVTIEKATPVINLSGTIINNNDQTNDLEIHVEMSVPMNGSMPMGKIQIECVDANHQKSVYEQSLSYDSVTHVFKDISEGTATITATYIPHNDEVNYTNVQGVTEEFEVIKDFIPVQAFDLVATELQFYTNPDGTLYANNPEIKLPFMISPDNASLQEINWESSNPNVVTIDASTGALNIHAEGEAIITARTKNGNFTHSCEVRIVKLTEDTVPVKGITLSDGCVELDLQNHATHTLVAQLNPFNATYPDVIWKSKDDQIATVDDQGHITAKSLGETQIIAVTKDGAKVATCDVKVSQSDLDNTPSEPSPEEKPDNPTPDDTPSEPSPEEKPDNPTPDDTPSEPSPEEKPDKPTPDDTPSEPSPEEKPDEPTPDDTPSEPAPEEKPNEPTPDDTPSEPKPEEKPDKPTPDDTPSKPDTDGSGSTGNNNSNPTNTPSEQPSTSTPTLNVSQFKDLTTHWAKDDIQFVLDKGLFKGVSATQFGANITMTRGMFVTALHRLAGTPQVGEAVFEDVKKEQYYTDAVSWANELGIVSGISATQFAPNQDITREQLVTILYQYAKMTGVTSEITRDTISQFKDSHQVFTWSKEAMDWAVGCGMIQGTANNSLAPKTVATRAQVAVILKRFIVFIEQSASV